MLVLYVHYNCIYFHLCEWVKGCKSGGIMMYGLVCWYVGECFPYFLNFDGKNLAKPSASSSSVLLSGKGLCVVLPVSLLTRQKSSLVSLL